MPDANACSMCKRMIINAGISRVIIGTPRTISPPLCAGLGGKRRLSDRGSRILIAPFGPSSMRAFVSGATEICSHLLNGIVS